jgi:hypothetical protein
MFERKFFRRRLRNVKRIEHLSFLLHVQQVRGSVLVSVTFFLEIKVKQANYRPWQALRVPGGWGSQILRHLACEGGKVGSRTHRPPLPAGNIPGAHLSRRQDHSAAGKIMSMKNSNDIIGNRSRDLSVCSSVLQPLRHRVPLLFRGVICIKWHHRVMMIRVFLAVFINAQAFWDMKQYPMLGRLYWAWSGIPLLRRLYCAWSGIPLLRRLYCALSGIPLLSRLYCAWKGIPLLRRLYCSW